MHNQTPIKDMAEEAYKKTVEFFMNSELMTFDWSNENQRYLEIKLNEAFKQAESCLKNFFYDADGEYELCVLHNKPHLKKIKLDKDRADHPIYVFSIGTGYSYMKIEHFESNTANYYQKVESTDIEFQLISMILKSLTRLNPNEVLKTIINDIVNTLESNAVSLQKNFHK